MAFFHQFDEFDPLTGAAPSHPFSQLPSIVSRARRLLKNRTRDEIISAAHSADFFMEEYFRAAKDNYIRRLLDRGGTELDHLPPESRNEAGVREFLDNWPVAADENRPDVPTSDNTTELEALKEGIGTFELDGDDDFPNGHEFEYFAVLALWLVADAIDWLKWTSDPQAQTRALYEVFAPIPAGGIPELSETINKTLEKSREQIPAFIESFQASMQISREVGLSDTSIRLSLAGSSALCATDAVCYAEHLKAMEVQARELLNLQTQIHQMAKATDDLAETKAKQRVSDAATKAAKKRHAESRSIKNDVLAWYAEHMHEYPSMEAAAGAVVEKKLVPMKFRTIRNWIAEYRKSVQSASRL